MKCHWCSKEIQRLQTEPNYIGEAEWYECPDAHLSLKTRGEEVISYTMYWDADDQALERYKIETTFSGTRLYLSKVNKPSYRFRQYKEIFYSQKAIPLTIKDGQVQFNNLVQRLKKLNIFS